MMSLKPVAVSCLVTALFFSANAADPEKIPSEKDAKTLARDSLLAFNKAVAAKDFTGFVAQVSKLWQGQVTAAQLAEIFKVFIEQGIDIGFIADLEPIFETPPAIDGDGVLVLKGHYDSKPNKVEFVLKYIYEKPAWKLFGINVHVTPTLAADVKLPPEAEARALAQDSLGNFNQAVLRRTSRNFTERLRRSGRSKRRRRNCRSSLLPLLSKESIFPMRLKAGPFSISLRRPMKTASCK